MNNKSNSATTTAHWSRGHYSLRKWVNAAERDGVRTFTTKLLTAQTSRVISLKGVETPLHLSFLSMWIGLAGQKSLNTLEQ